MTHVVKISYNFKQSFQQVELAISASINQVIVDF